MFSFGARAIWLAVLVVSGVPAKGGPQEDAISREVALKAAESYAKEKVANYLNQRIASTLPAGAGSSIFSTIDLGSAAYDFSRSENDKQRTYAGSRAAIAGYALLGGPAAPILGAALLVASVLESSMAAQHQAEMLKIYKHIQEQYTRITEIETQLLQAQWLQFRHLIAVSSGALAEYGTYIDVYKKGCSQGAAIVDLAGLDTCVMSISRAFAAARLFVDSAGEIADWRSRDSELIGRLEKAGALNLEDLISARTGAQKLISELGPKVDELYRTFATVAADLAVSEALSKPAFSTAEWVHLNCIDQAVGHSRSGTQLVFAARSLGERVVNTHVAAFVRGIDLYRSSLCTGLERVGDSAFKPTLIMWNEIVARTRLQVTALAQ